METASTGTTLVEREVRIDAPPDAVFPYLTDPELLCRWMGTDATLDPRPGGGFRLDVTPGNVAVGEYVEVDPPRRVVFTWGWEGDDNPVTVGSTRVEIALEPDGDGTVVRLTHSGLVGEWVERHDDGWAHYLARLAVAASGGDPGPDEWMQPPS
jgi:uncharacterized protein YndB with AHSA1/START domain